MSGAIGVPGNITPVAEFNCIADPVAAARVFALSSPDPAGTMPPDSVSNRAELPDYPPKEEVGEQRLRITMFPLDITSPHTLSQRAVNAVTKPRTQQGSPLAEWVAAFLNSTFAKSSSLYQNHNEQDVQICFHDPVCTWYLLRSLSPNPDLGWEFLRGEDVRVETMGQWTRGMCVVDRRGRKMREEASEASNTKGVSKAEAEVEAGEGTSADNGNWLSTRKRNRIDRCIETPGREVFQDVLLGTIFGLGEA